MRNSLLPLCLLAAALAGCGTVVPRPVAARQISIGDSGQADAGILAGDAKGFTVDPSFAIHYRLLCLKYRGENDLRVPPGAGLLLLPTGDYWVSKRTMANFLIMCSKERSGLKSDF